MQNLLNSDAECQELALALEDLVGAGSARGLRLNPLKWSKSREEFLHFLESFNLKTEAKVPWCERGFFVSATTSSTLGAHPIAGAGLIYLQEPGAMEAVEWLDPKPGDLVLDLCAAPGGKATQIAEKLMGKGWLVVNDPVRARADRLEALLARHGALNTSVYSLDPTNIAERFEGCFDKILVDAPCSGESLFAKRFDFRNDVRDVDVKGSARRQFVILSRASEMIRPGGKLVYSTCTYSKEENEGLVESFLENHPGWILIKDQRRWPHKDRVAGGYVALFQAPAHEIQHQKIWFTEDNKGLIKHGPWRWDGNLDEFSLVMAAKNPKEMIQNFPDYEILEEKINWEKWEEITQAPAQELNFKDATDWMKGLSVSLGDPVKNSEMVKAVWGSFVLGPGKKVPPGRLNNLVPKVLRS